MASRKKSSKSGSTDSQPELLTGGNPRIPKADGDTPVQDYIAAMPGWKSSIGHQLDRLIVESVPEVLKAVRWNTPFYGIDGQGWFVAFDCTTRYVKVAFFAGTSLDPVPPVASKQETVRYFHIHEDDELNEEEFRSWIRQAAALPGERLF